MDESQNITKRQKHDTQDHILYDSIYTAHQRKVSFWIQKAGLWLPGSGKGDQLWMVMSDLPEGMKMF